MMFRSFIVALALGLFGAAPANAAIGGVVPTSIPVIPQFGAVPYTGFNSFYAVGGSVSQTYMQDVSDYLITSGLQAAWGGEILAGIDESWTSITGATVTRDGSGHVIPSGSFSSMPALVAHIKANGQIPGIYRDGGQVGCATEDWGAGTYLSDLTYFFQTWGFQAVKSDGCGFFAGFGNPILSGRTVYGSADALLKSFGTSFLHLYGYSNFGAAVRGYTQGWAFASRMGSAAFRYSADVGGAGTCNIGWVNVLDNAHSAVQHVGATGHYHMNDADYLGANNNASAGTLNTNEAITQAALAATFSSPWVLACDPRNLGTTELAALKNADMIAALKDSWVRAGTRVDGGGPPNWEEFCKHLNTAGKRFIVAVNEDSAAQPITVDPSLCGVAGTYTLKNVLTGSTSSTSGTFSTGSLASHASGVYLITGGTESNATCWATNPGGPGQIANGSPGGCAFTADAFGNPAGNLPKDGTPITTAATIDTTLVPTNPSAPGCYQKQRKGVIEDDPNEAALNPTADNLAEGATYHYSIDLAEIEGLTAGQRIFSITITNGDPTPPIVLANIDVAALAGGVNKAIRLEGNIVATRKFVSFIAEPLSPPTGVPILGCVQVIKQ